MLSGAVGCAFLAAASARADNTLLFTKAPLATVAAPLGPAVDGFNEKLDAFAGSIGNRAVYGAQGSLGIPLARQYGAQIDGNFGSLGGDTYGAAAGHLFWRNPAQSLFGIYGSFTELNQFGGVRVGQVAGEAAFYWGAWTLEGIAGVEFGNSVNSTSSITTVVPPGGGPLFPPGVTTTSTFSQGFDVRTRFFDDINLKYYVNSNWDAYVGHRYLGGKNALALGSELALPLGHGIMGAAFVEGLVGEDSFHGIWGGLKFYFGHADKPLVARHRQDDPPNWTTDTLFSMLNNATSSSSTTSALSCAVTGVVPVNGQCVVKRARSDRRLKRDIVLIDRLANGLGLYRFRYLWSDTLYVGVIAQEARAVDPRAVYLADDGFLRVNYAHLGLRLLTWNEWAAGVSIAAERARFAFAA